MGKDYTNKGEYQGNEHSADVFKAPKKKLTKEERKQQSDMKKRKYLDTGELDTKGNPLLIKRDSTVQQGINRDKIKYGPTDKLIKKGKLKEVWDKHPDNPNNKNMNLFKHLLTIGAGGAAIVGQGLKSLLINPYGGI